MWFVPQESQGEEASQTIDASLNRQATIALATASQGDTSYAATLARGVPSYVFADSRGAHQALGKLATTADNTYTVKIAQMPSHFLAPTEALKLISKDGNLALADDATLQAIKNEAAPKSRSPAESEVYRTVIDARTKSLLDGAKAAEGTQVIQSMSPSSLAHTVSPPITVEQQTLNLSQSVAHALADPVQQEAYQTIQQPVVVGASSLAKQQTLVAPQQQQMHATTEAPSNPKSKGPKPSRWNDMLNILLEENWTLKMELKQCQKKLSKLQKFRGQDDKKNLVRLKRYTKAAGINIRNWDKFFWDCPCLTDKIQKLLDLLDERGVKGPPTMEKCRKLRKRSDRRKEVDELVNCTGDPDPLDAAPPSTRTRRKTAATRMQDMTQEQRERHRESFQASKARFSRLKNIVDSESDEDENCANSTSTGTGQELDFHDLDSIGSEGMVGSVVGSDGMGEQNVSLDENSMNMMKVEVPNDIMANPGMMQEVNDPREISMMPPSNMLVDSDEENAAAQLMGAPPQRVKMMHFPLYTKL